MAQSFDGQMAGLFKHHKEIDRATCDRYAEKVVGGTVKALGWQGCYSYTVQSEDERTVIQFMSSDSPLDPETVHLAKKIHPDLVPKMEHLGFVDGSSVSVWKMDKISGLGFMDMECEEDIKTKLLTTVVDLAKFFVEAWTCPQTPTEEQLLSARQEYESKLDELAQNSSSVKVRLQAEHCRTGLDEIFRLPWALRHDDLSCMNMLFDTDTGHLQGVVDWADADIRPFGVALYGLEGILGADYGSSSNPGDWHWHDDKTGSCRTLFSTALSTALRLSARQRAVVEKSRKLGLLLRLGFVWSQEAGRHVPQKNDRQIAQLELFIGRPVFR